ncbi:MAG: hypothetical protein ACJ74U_10775 [Jatrophihabitantaceae bacterium]
MTACAKRRGIDLIHKPGKIASTGGVSIEVDAATADEAIVVEA